MTDLQKEALDFIQNNKGWGAAVYRPNTFIFDHLIRSGGFSSQYVSKALGRENKALNAVTIAGNLYSSKQSIDEVREYLINLIDANKIDELFALRDRCLEAGNELVKVSKNIDNDLIRHLKAYKESYSYLTSFLLLVVYSDKVLQQKIEQLIKDKVGHLDDRYYKNISYPKAFNTSTQETIDILKLAINIRNNNWKLDDSKVKDLIQKHTEKYSWLNVRHTFELDFKYQDFELRIESLLEGDPQEELDNIYKARKDAEEITQEFIDKYKLSKNEIKLINLVKEFIYLRTFRTDSMYSSRSYIRPTLLEASKRLNINLDDLLLLTIDELIDLLEGKKVDIKNIKDREKDPYMVSYNGKTILFVGQDRKLIDDLNVFTDHLEFDSNDKELKGTPAYKGTIKGTAKIIMDAKDISKINKGDIMISVMTFPSLIPAMEKAAAFVTNEGGVLCHAAIVSREMKKPCLTATKHATKVFKDGDVVEVNADKGIVKKI